MKLYFNNHKLNDDPGGIFITGTDHIVCTSISEGREKNI